MANARYNTTLAKSWNSKASSVESISRQKAVELYRAAKVDVACFAGVNFQSRGSIGAVMDVRLRKVSLLTLWRTGEASRGTSGGRQ